MLHKGSQSSPYCSRFLLAPVGRSQAVSWECREIHVPSIFSGLIGWKLVFHCEIETPDPVITSWLLSFDIVVFMFFRLAFN